jgi:alpha-2-macroglobulin
MNARWKAWFGAQLRDPRWLVIAGVALVSVVVTVLTWDQHRTVTRPEAAAFSVSPTGDDVARLAPIRVTFAKAPSERDGAQVLQLEPAVAGRYAWLSDRTLLFQPDYPGLLRGKTYTVKVSARPEAGLGHAVEQQFTTSGALTVVQAIPSDGGTEVPSNAKVIVQFSRSVAPLTLLGEQKNGPVIAFDPPLEGTGEWLNTSLYRFTPQSLPPNTTYHLRIAAGLTSAADGALKDDYNWSFTTESPAVASITPDNATIYAGPRQQVVVTFNQAMDHVSVESGLRVTDAKGGVVAGKLLWSAAGDAVTFTPSAALAQAGEYVVAAPQGLKGANGGATKADRTSSFTTVGPPSITSTQPASGNTKAERFGISFQFSNPMDTDSFDGRVSVSGFTPDEVNQALNSSEQNLYVSLTLKPSSAYTVSLAAGIVDRYGQPLPPKTFSFRTGALPSSVSLATPAYGLAGTYAASAEPLLYFHATNVPSANFALYPLTAAEAAQWYSSTKGPNQFQPSQKAIRSWTEKVSGGQDEVVIASTSLSGGGPLPKGDYYVRTNGDFASEMAFAVVDTEIVTKLSTDSLLGWVIDHDTGKPLAGVTVRATGPGISNGDRQTDVNGLVVYPVPNTQNAFGPPRAYLLTVDDRGHRGVSSTGWQQGTAPYQLGIPQEYYTRTYVGQVFTDRPIYRPGESVNYKGIIRLDDDAAYSIPAANLPLVLVIRDAKGIEVLRGPFTLNEFGSFSGSLQLPGDATIGDYQVTIESANKDQPFAFVAQNSFLVAEFKKPEFQVDVTTGSANYVNGDAIDASVKASFFFGGAVTGAPVTWSTISSPFAMRVKGFETYSFSDYDYYRQAVVKQPVRSTGAATTDGSGVASFSVPATLSGNEGAQQFAVSGTVTDTNAQAVANSTTVTVHPAALYAGVRPTNYIATAGKDAGIDVVSVDTSGAPAANTLVTVRVFQRRWITTKTQTPDGARRYDSQPQDTLITTLTTTSDAKGIGHVVYSPSAIVGGPIVAGGGTLRITASVSDAKGRTETSATYLWVTGGGFASWQITNDDTIKLIADKDSYSVGDTAQVLVPAPFAGATGLVTVERGKVITQTVQQFATNSETLQIPIADHDVPNVFVSVVLYRPPTTEDPVPRYKVGYVELPVSTTTRQLKVTITPSTSQAKPGDTVHYQIKVTDTNGKGVKAELSVAVIDKALLSLQDERGPDGLKAFWFERGLGVFTASSLAVSVNRSNDVIAEPPAGGKGGGGLSDDRLRQDFRNTAYWDAQVQTNDTGEAGVDVKMPDNLTTWRMDARAISGGTMVGEGQNELVSTKPLLLRPALPRFLRVGDSVQLRTLVTNASGKASDVTVGLSADGVDLSSSASQKQTIAPGQSATFAWSATVTVPGTAKLTFTANGSGGLNDSVVQSLPVSQDVTPETTATGGIVTDESQVEAVFLPQYAILKGGSLQIAVQAALTGSLVGELSSLEPAPFEYSERIASRLMATLGVRRADKSAGRSTTAYDARIASDLAALAGQQKADGGWGWCDVCASDPNVTGWALIALGEGKRDGLNVDSTIISRATSYVFANLNRVADVAHPADPNQKAFLLYGLSLATQSDQSVAVSSARALFEQYRAKLASWGRAYLLLAINASGAGRDDATVSALVNDIASATIPSANGNHWEDARVEGTFMTNTAATALVLEALVHADPQNRLVAQTVRWLMVARGAEGWSTTTERGQAILALSDYSASTGELAGNFSYRVTLNGVSVLAGAYKPGDSSRTDKTSAALTTLSAGKQSIFEFARQAGTIGRLYYTLNLKYLTPAKDVEALNRGFAVSHEYTLLNDPSKPITEARLGDTVRVTVTVVAPADRNYVVVEDLLPAGLEPVDPRLKSTDPALVAQLRADRQKAGALHEGDYYAPWLRWYFDPWQHVDTRDDRVSLFTPTLSKGVYEYVYYARATTPGDFFVGPAHAQETYFPDVFGRSDSGRFSVAP